MVSGVFMFTHYDIMTHYVFWLLHFGFGLWFYIGLGFGYYIGFGFGLKCCVVKLVLFQFLNEKHLIGVRIEWLLGC